MKKAKTSEKQECRYWLFKSEPSAFSIDHLDKAARKTAPWDGVRNYQARNFLRDDVQIGDLVLFYHSREEPLGIFGTMRVAKAGYPDKTAFDPESKYYDPKSDPDHPRWYLVECGFPFSRSHGKNSKPSIGLPEFPCLPIREFSLTSCRRLFSRRAPAPLPIPV